MTKREWSRYWACTHNNPHWLAKVQARIARFQEIVRLAEEHALWPADPDSPETVSLA